MLKMYVRFLWLQLHQCTVYDSEMNKVWALNELRVGPLISMSDQHRLSPYNINTITSRKVMWIMKNIN